MDAKENLSLEQLKEIQETFKLLDDRGDGKIRLDQVGQCLRILGQNPTEADIKKIIQELELNGRVSLEMFHVVYEKISGAALDPVQSSNDFIKVLRYFENIDEKGSIPFSTLRYFLTVLGEKLTEEEVEELFRDRIDSNGNVNYEEFVKMIMEK